MNILVTGGTGFIGSHLIPRLIAENHKVILLKRSASQTWRIKKLLKKLVIFDLDILKSYRELFNKKKIDLIIHLSGKYLKYDPTISEVEEMNKVNINHPAKLLQEATKSGVKSFINTGTFFEYKKTKGKINEHNQRQPFNYYTATKMAFEEILKFYAAANLIKAVTLKLFSPYGEKDNEKIIPKIVKTLIHKGNLDLTKGEQRLSFTYVEDTVDSYVKAIEFIDSPNYWGYEIFNIGNPKTYSLKQIVKILQKFSANRQSVNLGMIPYSQGEIMVARCDSSKAEKKLGWKPKTDIYAGLAKTFRYYLEHEV